MAPRECFVFQGIPPLRFSSQFSGVSIRNPQQHAPLTFSSRNARASTSHPACILRLSGSLTRTNSSKRCTDKNNFGPRTGNEARSPRKRCITRLGSTQPPGESRRRLFLTHLASYICFMALISPSPVRAVPPRTIFDEEREMNERAKKEFENARNDALRAGFEAVHKAREQLDDLQALIEDENWGGVRQFTRLFNNSVEREGMEAIASKLPEKSDRMAALEVARGMTSSLIQIDRCALQKDRTKAILGVDEVRKAISRFESFKP